jgi:hypothetical protein
MPVAILITSLESSRKDGNRDARGVAPGGFVYHVLNRSVGRLHMFRKESDFEAFERVVVEAHLRQPIRILYFPVRVLLADRHGDVQNTIRAESRLKYHAIHPHPLRFQIHGVRSGMLTGSQSC